MFSIAANKVGKAPKELQISQSPLSSAQPTDIKLESVDYCAHICGETSSIFGVISPLSVAVILNFSSLAPNLLLIFNWHYLSLNFEYLQSGH